MFVAHVLSDVKWRLDQVVGQDQGFFSRPTVVTLHLNAVIVENQKDIMTVERYIRILYAPARQPKDRLLDALDQIDKIHKDRPNQRSKRHWRCHL